jgi:trimeric autotransporter adhesin
LKLSTPLKEKSPNFSANSILSIIDPSTPKPSQSSAATPFTEGRSRRIAATKADKYIDIVSRRLAEVPANGSTPKSMKIASKLISEASPNSRRNILLSQSLATTKVQSTPISEKNKTDYIAIPAQTPASVRKRNRTAKIHQMFQTPLMTLASAANKESCGNNSVETFSPSNVNVAPSTISRPSKLNQVHGLTDEPSVRKPSPVNEIAPIVPERTASPFTSMAKVSSKKSSPAKEPLKRPSPLRKSPKVSPAKQNDRVADFKTQIPSVAATPKVPIVEFVAPQSVLRSSKRPRKPTIFHDESSSTASPAFKKQAKLTDSAIFPAVSVNSQSQVKITPQTPVAVQVTVPALAPLPQSTRSSNVPAIIVPLSAAKLEDSSSTEDLHDLSKNTRKTPLRVQPAKTPLRAQPAKTPTRAKAVIPSLSDYSAAAKIAVIEVAKNTTNNNNNNGSNFISGTTKVEPWTSKYIQKEAPTKASLNVNVKPVDTSKISGFSSATVPIVPRFPLNLANISNITKTAIITDPVEIKPAATAQNTKVIPTISSSSSASSQPTVTAPPPESPLTRAKRIDLENSNREEKLKTMMETKADKLNKVMGDLKSSEKRIESIRNASTAVNSASSSKLPVKPKANATALPSPKIPSRLAEAFSGIDSELPPIDIGLVDDEKILKNVLNGASTKEALSSSSSSSTTTKTKTATAPAGFVNPKMKKSPAIINNENNPINSSNSNNANPTATPNNSATQLHKTAVLNSAARKINESKHTTKPPVTATVNIPSTPKPLPSKTSTDNSSPFLPEIPSE